jgi:uncharacterized repeat protein (TIGR03803 family)
MACVLGQRTLQFMNHGVSPAAVRLVLAFMLVLGAATAQTFTVLYEFTNVPDGADPSVLIRDSAGNLYGTTAAGGTVCDTYGNGCGTVFKLDSSGTETVLYRFSGGTDGGNPEAGLVRDSAGNLYGTTRIGGANGVGTVFKVDPSGKETVLYSFDTKHGNYPASSLVRDSEGNLYGVTSGGGGYYQYGMVFEISAAGKESVLHKFTGGSDGKFPFGRLVRDSSGNLYGSTSDDQASAQKQQVASYSYGTIFKLTHTGKKSVLHRFSVNQVQPTDGLIRGADGNFYGTTYLGGGSDGCNNDGRGCGTVFKLNENGKFTVLYTFQGGTDGGNPVGNLTPDAQGNLYGVGWNSEGTGCFGGPCGMVFELGTNDVEKVLYTFEPVGGTRGGGSSGSLLLDAAGNFYGSGGGGTGCGYGGCGVIFELTP